MTATSPAIFNPSGVAGYSPAQLAHLSQFDHLRVKVKFGGGDAARSIVQLPIQACKAIMVGPDSDIDRFYISNAQQFMGLPTTRSVDPAPTPSEQSDMVLPSQTAPFMNPANASLCSVESPFVGTLSRIDPNTPIIISPARLFDQGSYGDGEASCNLFGDGYMMDLIVFLSGAPPLQALRAPRVLANYTYTSLGNAFPVTGIPIFGRKHVNVAWQNTDATHTFDYKVNGGITTPSSGTQEFTFASGTVAAGLTSTAHVAIDNPLCDLLILRITLPGGFGATPPSFVVSYSD
jgi:hypothetical protein